MRFHDKPRTRNWCEWRKHWLKTMCLKCEMGKMNHVFTLILAFDPFGVYQSHHIFQVLMILELNVSFEREIKILKAKHSNNPMTRPFVPNFYLVQAMGGGIHYLYIACITQIMTWIEYVIFFHTIDIICGSYEKNHVTFKRVFYWVGTLLRFLQSPQ